MRHLTVPGVSLVLLAGCAAPPTQRIDGQALSAVRGQSVATTQRTKADFTTLSPGNAMFGMLGAVAGISEGKRIVTENKVEDPANAIAAALARSLQTGQGAQVVPQPLAIDTDDVARIANAAKGKARFIVDVKTTTWSSGYFPFDWTHYRVMYAANARLIDTETQKVLAQGTCRQVPETNAGAPTSSELFGQGAARLKTIIAAHAQTCLDSLRRDMLGIAEGAAPAAPAMAAQ